MTDSVNIRSEILDILLSVTRDGVFSHIALREVLDKNRNLQKQDRAFITRVSEGTIEHMIELDFIIDQISKIPVRKMKPVIQNILRSGVYQLKYMDSVPDSAACNEAVKLAGKRGFSGLKAFVNGVMRSVARHLKAETICWPDQQQEPVRYLSVTYSMPEWLAGRMIRQFGFEKCEKIFQSFFEERPTSVRVNISRISPDDLRHRLELEGIRTEQNPRIPYALLISGYDNLNRIPEFQEGLFYIQDTASMFVAEMAEPKKGDFVLDVCAAPGGKSLHAAELLQGSGIVEARDLTEAKVSLIIENVRHYKFNNVRTTVWDATVFDESLEEKADIVIADLPCSGLGVLGTKTDIKYHASEEKIQDLAELQRKILATVHRYVKKGGVLMYSTCTITEDENQKNVEWFQKEFPEFMLQYSRQLLPDEGCDGFFIARFVKVG